MRLQKLRLRLELKKHLWLRQLKQLRQLQPHWKKHLRLQQLKQKMKQYLPLMHH